MPDTFTLDDDNGQPSTAESADILESMPFPQQHAIDAAGAGTGDESTVEADVDSAGDTWNPAIHATGADNKGIKTAKGVWRKRRGQAGQVSKIGGKPSTGSPVIQQPQVDTQAQLNAQARAAGAAAAGSIFMLGRALGGEDWAPTSDEVTLQSEAWSNYFMAKGIYDFPPGLALFIAVSGYAAPRFFTPKTQERVGTIKHWLAIRIAKRRVKKALKKLGIEAVVTIKGSKSADVYDSILVNGQPFNDLGLKPDGTRSNPRNDTVR